MAFTAPSDDRPFFILLHFTSGKKIQIPKTVGEVKTLEHVVYQGRLFKYKAASGVDANFVEVPAASVYVHPAEEM